MTISAQGQGKQTLTEKVIAQHSGKAVFDMTKLFCSM